MDGQVSDNHYIFGNLLSGGSYLTDYFKKNGRIISRAPRMFIIRQGEIPDGIYLMDSGIVEKSAVSEAGRKKIFSINMGYFIAGTASIDKTPSIVSYQCLAPARFYMIGLGALPWQDKRFLSELFKYMTYETGLVQNQLRLETISDSMQNVFRIIDEFDEVKNSCTIDKHFVLTHQIIADMIGRTREQVTNILYKLLTNA